MSLYKALLNPFTGKLQLVRGDSAFHMKDPVATYNDLPVTANNENDVRITSDTDKMYTWKIPASSGSLSDWLEIGSSASIDWSAIANGPASSPEDIDDAVAKKHDHTNKATLDGTEESFTTTLKNKLDGLSSGTVYQNALNKLNDNIILNAFRIAVNGSLSVFNMVDGIVDEYEDETGIDTDNSVNELYDAGGDFYGIETFLGSYVEATIHMTSDTAPSPNVTSASSINSASYPAWKAFNVHATGEPEYWASADFTTVGNWIKYDFGVGNEKTIERLRMMPYPNIGFNSFKLQGSNNDSDWVDVLSDSANAVGYEQFDFSNSTAYRYYRVLCVTAYDNLTSIYDIEMYELQDAPTGMTLYSDVFTAETEPDTARIVILEEDVDAVTLNTDIKAWVSRDGGSSWIQGTLSDEGDYDSSKRILTADFTVSGIGSGTSMIYKVTTHNSKDLKIHGGGVNWA